MKNQNKAIAIFKVGNIVTLKTDTTRGKVIEVLPNSTYRIMFGDYNYENKQALWQKSVRRTVIVHAREIMLFVESKSTMQQVLETSPNDLDSIYSIA